MAAHGASPAEIRAVDELLAAAADVARTLHGRGLADRDELLLSAGGSIFFDRVIAAFAPLRAEIPGLEIVLRSGGYISHDAGRHHRLSPLDGRRPDGEETPAAGGADAVGVGAVGARARARHRRHRQAGRPLRRRTADTQAPVPGGQRRRGRLATARVTKLMDQHALVDLDPDQPVAPGDIMSFGVCHPCAAFDRWRFLPLIDADGTVVDGVVTSF